MQFNNTKIKMSMTKIKIIRPEDNPKNCNLNVNMDWNIEYTKNNQNSVGYVCTLETNGELPVKLAIQGLVETEKNVQILEKNYKDLSKHILDKTTATLLNLLNITKDSIFTINEIPTVHLTNNHCTSLINNL